MDGMKPVTRALQTLAAVQSETRQLILAEAPSARSTETDAEIAPLVEKIGATPIGEIEKLIGDLQEAKNFLQSEWERIQRETTRYTNLAQKASASVKIIFDTVRGWREAGYPRRQPFEKERVRNHTRFGHGQQGAFSPANYQGVSHAEWPTTT